ncbi:hypothetical protein L1987_48669 [Smallanthus sonchifolius]|uniref:Uncharacterized protein n=1 Tax=Smallanthus sonchifolius TaxID=185202 RepID=A0ACB9FTI1_9ASTR|nr:hypothetical protein L1987_48669 [Smallanthus sonchifolius]
MAKKSHSYKPLDPNASPYIKIPASFFLYAFPPPQPYTAIPPPFCTYNIRLQPAPRKPFSVSHPQPVPAKKINLPLTPVASGPRIPKYHKAAASDAKQMKWRPKCPEKKLGFERTRWKNSRREYQISLPLETNTTSLMIKNVPNKYTRKLLIQTLDAHCEAENKKIKDGDKGFVSSYDFLYLPIDFNRRTNAGFAFANFTSPEAALKFRDAFNGKGWNRFDSLKVAEISRARIQGKEALVNNCKGMDFTYGSEDDMPVWFDPARDGSGEICSRMLTVGKCVHW